jgi:hypothetical protein
MIHEAAMLAPGTTCNMTKIKDKFEWMHSTLNHGFWFCINVYMPYSIYCEQDDHLWLTSMTGWDFLVIIRVTGYLSMLTMCAISVL